jgi:hypothetical protein
VLVKKLRSHVTYSWSKSNISVETNLENVTAFIDSKVTQNKDEILHALYECAAKLPEKLMVYTTLIGLVNVKNYNFVGEVNMFCRGFIPNKLFASFVLWHQVCRSTGKKSERSA